MKWSDTYRSLDYSVYANLGYVKDTWKVLDEAEGLEAWRSAIGHPNTRLQGYLCEGIIRTQEQLDALPEGFTQFGRKPILGTFLFKDIRGSNYSEGADGKSTAMIGRISLTRELPVSTMVSVSIYRGKVSRWMLTSRE